MPPPWIAPNLEKNLNEEKYDLKTSQSAKVHPMGDFRYNEKNRARKLDTLMGIIPKQNRNEIHNDEPIRSLTEEEKQENNRLRAKQIADEASFTAMKRDGSASADEDGYVQREGPPKFRDGYNNTLRVKPAAEDHLHNGLKSLKERQTVQFSAIQSGLQKDVVATTTNHALRAQLKVSDRMQTTLEASRSQDKVLELSKKTDMAAIIGNYFVKGISSNLSGMKGRDVNSHTSIFRNEHSAESLEGGGAQGIEKKAEETPEAEEARRQFISISRALGNAFVNLGMTLPAGKRDDPLRNDSVALEIGNRMMSENIGVRAADEPVLEESSRREVAIALGRAMLHLRAAAGIEASRGQSATMDSALKDRTLKMSIGKLTLQLLESTAARSGKMLTRDPVRREVLAKALGEAMIQMEAGTLRKNLTDRNKKELNVKQKSVAFGPIAATREVASFRTEKSDKLVHRPLVPGRESQPVDVPRYLPQRG